MTNQVFQFKASLDKKIYRIIEIKENKSLYDLAKIIVKSFKFDLDHCFGFYDNLKNISRSKEIYELFVDLEEEREEEGDDEDAVNLFDIFRDDRENRKGVKNTLIKDVFIKNKKMLFLFDYGDDWFFLLECKDIISPTPKARYPRIVKEVGVAPEQYPEYDESNMEETNIMELCSVHAFDQ